MHWFSAKASKNCDIYGNQSYEAKLIMYRSSHPEMFCQIDVLRHFTKFTRKNAWSAEGYQPPLPEN